MLYLYKEKSDKLKKIVDVAKQINLNENDLQLYGKYIAKINNINSSKNGKLILVTSINPTIHGEGKTTLSIGLNDSLNKIGYKSVASLREPSLGPVFGSKGGAVGGGKSKIEPSDEINLHFTGDMHAITCANNLLCAIVDNHIYQGNDLNISNIAIKRCLDINDRSLRNNFIITPATEIMAILCLSKNIDDLKEKISNIIVGYTPDNKEIYVKDLNAQEALTILLKDAIKPNLVQSLYNNPIIVHGGPFANIAHGCSSLISIITALKLSDYVVTEAGFGSDLGAIKFFDILCKNNDIYPDVVVLNCTINALKYNGNGDLKKGICNLEFHINNMKKYTDNLIVSLNNFDDDLIEEIDYVKSFCKSRNVDFCISTNYKNGEDGCIELAKKISSMSENKKRYNVYLKDDDIYTKISKMCINELGASEIKYSTVAKEKLDQIKDTKMDICISKTPMSITDNSKILGYPKNFELTITDIDIKKGAGFITILLGNVLTMPGLSKKSNYIDMKIENNKITGIK